MRTRPAGAPPGMVLRSRQINTVVGGGLIAAGCVVAFLAFQAASTGGGIRPGVAIGLGAAVQLLAGFRLITMRVIVDEDAVRWRGLIGQRSVSRTDLLGAEPYRCRPGRGGGPQWGIRLWVLGKAQPRPLPLRWSYTASNQAMLAELCRQLDVWRARPAPLSSDRRP